MLSYKWKWPNFWFGIILFWLISMIGMGIIQRTGADFPETGWVTLVMLSYLILCMANERGEWSGNKKVVFVLIGWVVELALSIPVAMTIGILYGLAGKTELAGRGIEFFASLPVVIYAMRRSKLFVTKVSV